VSEQKKTLLHRIKPEEQDEIFRIVIGDILRALFNEKERVSIGITMQWDVNCNAKTLCRIASLCRNQWTTQTAISVSFGIIMHTSGNYTNSVWICPQIHKSSLHYSSWQPVSVFFCCYCYCFWNLTNKFFFFFFLLLILCSTFWLTVCNISDGKTYVKDRINHKVSGWGQFWGQCCKTPKLDPALFSLVYILEVPAAVEFSWWIVY